MPFRIRRVFLLGLALTLLAACAPGRYGTRVVGLAGLPAVGPAGLRVSLFALDGQGRVVPAADDGTIERAASEALAGRGVARLPWGDPRARLAVEVQALCADPRQAFEAHGPEPLLPPAEAVRPFKPEPDVYAWTSEAVQPAAPGCEGRLVLVLRETAQPYVAAVGKAALPCPAVMGCPLPACRDSLARTLRGLMAAGLSAGH
jgi:hypothetical protein